MEEMESRFVACLGFSIFISGPESGSCLCFCLDNGFSVNFGCVGDATSSRDDKSSS